MQAIDKVDLPEVGTTVAVSGFRIDEKTILSTRVTSAGVKQSLLRTHTDLPFKGKTTRWLVQTHVSNDQATFKLDGITHAIQLKQKTKKTLNDQLGIKILKLQEPASGQLKLNFVIESVALPRGRQTQIHIKQPVNNMMPGATPGRVPGSIPGAIPGSTQGSQPGSMPNMKR